MCRFGFRSAVAALALLSAGANSSFAQQIDEIVVTSQKRSAAVSVQDISAAITAVDAGKIEATQAVDLSDIGRLAPNAALHPTATFTGASNFFIRGMGVTGSNRTLDPAVGVIVDGIYLGYVIGANLSTFDRESIEVLRGPQGTLQGRNVTGGAVILRTRRPDGDYRVKADLTMGDYNRFDASVSVEGSIADGVAAKLAIQSQERDGYWEDTNGGTIDLNLVPAGATYDPIGTGQSGTKPDVDKLTIRPMLYFTPSADLDISIIAEFMRDKSGSSNTRFVNPADPTTKRASAWGYVAPSDPYKINHNLFGYGDLEVDSLTTELNYRGWGGVLTAIAGFRDLTYDSSTDFDGSPFIIFEYPDNHEEQEQTTLEIRYANSPNEKLSYVVGINYFDQEYFVGERRRIAGASGAFGDTKQVTEVEHNSLSVFGELDYFVTDQLKLTAGLRWTDEEKDADFSGHGDAAGGCNNSFVCTGPQAHIKGNLSNDDVTPKVALTYYHSDDVSSYLSYTRGFRSGAFNSRATTVFQFRNPAEPETVDSYEAGFKSLLLDKRLMLNAAIFQADYTDMQVAEAVTCTANVDGCPASGSISNLQNAGEASIEGIEIELAFQATDGLLLEASYGSTDAEYDKFPGLTATEAAAKKFERVPEYNYALAATYSSQLASGGSVDTRLSYNYRDDYCNDATCNSVIKQEGYGLFDASLTYRSPDDKYRLILFGQNLGDEDYVDFGLIPGIHSVTWGGAPRTYGLRIVYEFN